MEMNRGKRLFISPWGKRFLVFHQRQQNLVSGQSGLNRWNDYFRKRLENIYLSSITHRIEIRSLLWNHGIVLRFPFVFRNLLKSLLYGKSHPYGDKGINTYQGSNIRFYPVAIFNRYTNSVEGGIKYANDMRLPVIRQRREILDPQQIRFLHTVQNTVLKRSKGIISFSRTRRKPVSDRVTIPSMKSFQRTALRSQYGDMNHGIKDYSGMTGDLISDPGRDRPNLDQIQHEFASVRPYQEMTLKEPGGHEQYDRTVSGPVKDLISAPGEYGENMDQLYEDQAHKYPGRPDEHKSSEFSKNFLIKPEDLNLKYKDEGLHFRYKGYKRKFTERTGRVSLSHTRRTLIVNHDTVRSMKPYKRVILESSPRDLKYGDSRNDRIYSGIAGRLTSDPDQFISNMGQINMNNRRDYSGGTENLNPHEAPDTVRPFIHDGLKPFQQKHMPVIPFRHERAGSIQTDTIYAIPPGTQAETKSARGPFSSILTSDITREFSRSLSLTSQNETSLNNIARTENPFWEKKDTEKTGASIDYNKVADRVYEILMRRIIREKERMGELI
ncbi:MAG: hypothetical protein ACMUIU_13230 [bacterium]